MFSDGRHSIVAISIFCRKMHNIFGPENSSPNRFDCKTPATCCSCGAPKLFDRALSVLTTIWFFTDRSVRARCSDGFRSRALKNEPFRTAWLEGVDSIVYSVQHPIRLDAVFPGAQSGIIVSSTNTVGMIGILFAVGICGTHGSALIHGFHGGFGIAALVVPVHLRSLHAWYDVLGEYVFVSQVFGIRLCREVCQLFARGRKVNSNQCLTWFRLAIQSCSNFHISSITSGVTW